LHVVVSLNISIIGIEEVPFTFMALMNGEEWMRALMSKSVGVEDMSHALLAVESDASLSSTSIMATLSDESAASLSSKLRKLLITSTKLTSNSNTLEAEVDSLLQSNDLPPPQKRDEIASILHENAFFVSEAEDTLADLTTFTNKVREMKEQTAKKVDRYRIVLHPIRVLQAECLARIFEACVSEGSGSWEEYFSGPPLATIQENRLQRPNDGDPWTLSKICTQWRKVAMDNPRLWSNVVLFISEEDAFGTDPPRPGPSSLLNLQLTRSKNALLSIAIHGFGAKTSIPVLQGIMFHSCRWKCLYMDIPYSALEVFNQITQAQLLPNLEELYYSNPTSPRVQDAASSQAPQDPHLPFLDNFHVAPNLRRVCVDPRFLMRTPALAAKIVHTIKPLRQVTVQVRAAVEGVGEGMNADMDVTDVRVEPDVTNVDEIAGVADEDAENVDEDVEENVGAMDDADEVPAEMDIDGETWLFSQAAIAELALLRENACLRGEEMEEEEVSEFSEEKEYGDLVVPSTVVVMVRPVAGPSNTPRGRPGGHGEYLYFIPFQKFRS
jgi:hypothetical protein